MLLFGRPLLVRIFDELKRGHPEGLVEARIAQIMVSSPASTEDDGAATRWGEHMRILESPHRDPLLALVALRVIEEECTTSRDLESAEAAGIIDRVALLAQDDSGRVPEEVRAGALKTLAGLCRVEHRVVDSFETRFRLGPFLRSILGGEDDEALKIAAYPVVASLATNGELTLRGWVNDLLAAPVFVAPIASDIGNPAGAALAACARIFEATLSSDPAQRILYASLGAVQARHPVDVVIARCHSLDEGIGQMAYRLLSAMLQHHWVLEDALDSSGLTKFLFDREGEPSLHGLQSRYLIIQALATSGHIRDPELLARLHRYLQRGINYYAATPSISTLRR